MIGAEEHHQPVVTLTINGETFVATNIKITAAPVIGPAIRDYSHIDGWEHDAFGRGCAIIKPGPRPADHKRTTIEVVEP